VDNDKLLHVWKEFALKVKREKKDSLYSILVGSDPKLRSDLVISIHIKNTIAAQEFNSHKSELLGYLRSKLKNNVIQIKYKISETIKTEYADSKTKFDKLVKENQSLEKLRKLFNLDIEF